MTEAQKITALNNLETIYDETIDVVLAHWHDAIYFYKPLADDRFFGPTTDGVGSGANAGTLDGYTAADISASSVSPGFIVMYADTGYSFPSGWAEYSAANGRFPVGAGATYAVKATGGTQMTDPLVSTHGTIASYSLSIYEMPPHTHTFTQYINATVVNKSMVAPLMNCYAIGDHFTHTGYAYDDLGGTAAGYAHGHNCTVQVNSINHTPPYMILKFMKKS